MNKILPIFLVLFIQMVSAYENIIYTVPEVGEISQTYVGEKILVSGYGQHKDCLIPQKEFLKKQFFGTYLFFYKKQVPICKKSEKEQYFISWYPNYFMGGDSYGEIIPVFHKKQKNGTHQLCQVHVGGKTGCIKGLEEKDLVVKSNLFVPNYGLNDQTITYLGRSQGVHKFLYEELRLVGSQDISFEVDTVEDLIIFKGAILEIIKSDSSSITVKVIRGFSK